MTRSSRKLFRYLPFAALLGFAGAAGIAMLASEAPAQAAGEEPIAYIGHGAFFERNGHQVVPTAEWVAKAQDWYRAKLLSGLDERGKAAFAIFERRLASIEAKGQAALVVRQRALEWLTVNVPKAGDDHRTIGKISAISAELNLRLPVPGVKPRLDGGLFQLDPAIRKRLDAPDLRPGRPQGAGGRLTMMAAGAGDSALPTLNEGAAYRAQCEMNGVPIPPPINELTSASGRWVKEGFILQSDQFIEGTPAEIRSFTTPQGVCIALPRSTDNNRTRVKLDGVICQSRITSKVCFWDNQMDLTADGVRNAQTFQFNPDEKIPIGVPDLSVDPMGRFQAGGAALENGAGGVCTDCHAGENVYIVHPDSELQRERPMSTDLEPISPTLTMGEVADRLNFFAPERYDPIVAASWPQNSLSQAAPLVPEVCADCHVQFYSGGSRAAGRFPHLSTSLNGDNGYCQTVLRQSLQRTMPRGNPGGLYDGTVEPGDMEDRAAVEAFVAWCMQPGTSGSDGGSSRGEPHLVTTNGVSYDFQSAGEFTALRNSATGFELQTRQTPVTASFIPGPNLYTGLQSCLSVNTAAALRIGRSRVTYQPEGGQRMVLRVDGKPVKLAKRGLSLGGGNRIGAAPSGQGITVAAADGTRVAITSEYWGPVSAWYLNIEVVNTPAREGLMGYIVDGQWLPLGPDGRGFGPAPDTVMGRDDLLNHSFADAWRVTPAISLFNYAPGTSTATFTDRGWPPKVGTACAARPGLPTIPGPGRKIRPLDRQTAEKLCRRYVRTESAYRECVYDTMVMGDPNVPAGYARSLAARRALMP